MVAIGIDLGNTHSCVAFWRNGGVEIIPNEQGNRVTPSYVAFTKNDIIIGDSAKNQAVFNPSNTIFGAKRLIGRKYGDMCVQMALRHLPFRISNDEGKPIIIVDYENERKSLSPEEISAIVLRNMKELAEKYLGREVKDAVITVPAYFNDSQRQATRIAGIVSGLNVLRIINEPTAAALAYGVDSNLKGEKNVLVYDLGGGTFDVSILTIDDGTVFEVKATAGNASLGGDDFDNRIMAYVAEDFKNKHEEEIIGNVKAMRRLKNATESAKRCLTSATEALIEIQSLKQNIDYTGAITRATFEDLCSDLFKDTLLPIKQALVEARMTENDINEVILVGGSTRIPKIKSMIQDFFNRKNIVTSINPEEAVAYGAAIQAAILSGYAHERIDDLLLVDVVPLSLGIETARGLMFTIVEKNTPVPCEKTKEITTLEDNQSVLTIEVFQGERTLTKDNNLLGTFELTKVIPAPRGIPKIDVTFHVNADGILNVTAQDRTSGNHSSIVIDVVKAGKLNNKNIDKMLANAEVFRQHDKRQKHRLEARNQLESYVYKLKNVANKIENCSIEILMDCEDVLLWLSDNNDAVKEDFDRRLKGLKIKWSGIMDQSETESEQRTFKRQKTD